MAARLRFTHRQRLAGRSEFLRVRKDGRAIRTKFFTVGTMRRTEGLNRLGIVTNRRLGGAVIRTRIRRLVREFYRVRQFLILGTADIVIVPTPAAAALSAAEFRTQLEAACLKAGLLPQLPVMPA